MNDYLQYLNESPTVFFQCRNEKAWPVDFVTQNIKEIFGYEADDFVFSKLGFIDIVYEEDKAQILEEVEAISKTKEDKYEFKPYRVITKDNKLLWVQDITKILRDTNKKATHFFCYITDITNQIHLHEKLSLSEDIISTIYNNSFQFIGLMKIDGTLIKANKTSLDFANIKEEEVIGKKFWDCPWWQHSKTEQMLLQQDIKKAANGEFIRTQKIHFDNEGNKIYVDFSIKPVFNHNKEVVYLIPEGHDITENIKKEEQLRRYMKIIDDNVLISTTNIEGRILENSKKFARLCEYSQKELLGNKHNIIKHPDNKKSSYKELWQTITKGEVWKGEHKNLSKNGKTFWVENIITPNFNDEGDIESFTSIYNDITDKKEVEELLITDVLTNIYNRRHFNTVFESELRRCKRYNHSFVLMILDIDYFKQYNDIYGHYAGDKALIKVAKSLKDALHRSIDYVFRLGGEEFAILTSDISRKDVENIANRLKNSVEELEIKHEGSDISKYLTISIGIKYIDELKHISSEQIYKKADKALYKVKESSRNAVFID